MMIDSEVIQKILRNYSLACNNGLHIAISEAIKPKSIFAKGEIVEVNSGSTDATWELVIYNRPTEGGHIVDYDGVEMDYEKCRKLDSIPLATIAHDSADRPEGLKDDDDVLARHKHDRSFVMMKVKDISWKDNREWVKVHFVNGGSDNDV